ncbi:hypothetical protein BC830DRAFT_871216 [Chytriomyces sp. MP71]|nr:hypothetical protein BC830DRAFT_871216 [Chytriomyces sp. MP71]
MELRNREIVRDIVGDAKRSTQRFIRAFSKLAFRHCQCTFVAPVLASFASARICSSPTAFSSFAPNSRNYQQFKPTSDGLRSLSTACHRDGRAPQHCECPGLCCFSGTLIYVTHSSQSAHDEITTIFVVGFPEDIQEREFQNMVSFILLHRSDHHGL